MPGPDDTTSPGRDSVRRGAATLVVGRRALMTGALGLAGLVGLAGCRLRLEDDAPAAPLTQRRSIPDQDLLVAARNDSAALASALAGRAAPLPTALRGLGGLHEHQVAVLDAALESRGVPRSDITVPPSSAGSTSASTPSATASTTATAASTTATSNTATSTTAAAELASAESALLDTAFLTRVASATELNRPLLVALLAQRASAATLLGAKPDWPTSGEALPPAVAAELLDQTRAAIFGFDIVTARSTGAQRAHAWATLAWLEKRRDEQEQLAGAAAAPPALAYDVGTIPKTPAGLARSARTLLGHLVDAGLTPLPDVPANPTAVATLIRWQADAQVRSVGWSGPLLAFPGLTDT